METGLKRKLVAGHLTGIGAISDAVIGYFDPEKNAYLRNPEKGQAEVLSLIAQGLSNGEIASTLVVSEATVKTHINHMFAKTGARDRAQAVHYAYRHGMA